MADTMLYDQIHKHAQNNVQDDELPMFIKSLGEWIWGNAPNPNISPEICLHAVAQWQMSWDCGMQIVVKAMGISMILGACFNKAPTLLNIVQSKSTTGIPKSSIYGETLIAANATLYGYLQHFPFTAYGENAAICLQCMGVAYLMWHYSSSTSTTQGNIICKEGDRKTIHDLELATGHHHHHHATKTNSEITTTLPEKLIVTSCALVYLFWVLHFLPSTHYHLLMSSVMPLMAYARGNQILEAYRIQHTGAQSVATTTISLGGNVGRILTTIKEVGLDYAALSWYLVSAILNGGMLMQYLWYRKNTQAFFADELRRRQKQNQ